METYIRQIVRDEIKNIDLKKKQEESRKRMKKSIINILKALIALYFIYLIYSASNWNLFF